MPRSVRKTDASGRSCKNVKIGNNSVTAVVDIGNDLCLMRADKYIQIGAPPLQGKEVSEVSDRAVIKL